MLITIFVISSKTILLDNSSTVYRLQLNEVPHYVSPGFDLDQDTSKAAKVPAGSYVGADAIGYGGRSFLQPGDIPYEEFTITAPFNYSAQYDKLMANTDIVPGIKLPGLGDSYKIYLNGQLIASEWHVKDGKITSHRLARGTVYPINPSFFVRGENVLTFLIYGDPSTVDTGITVSNKYAIDELSALTQFDYSQTIFGGICLAVALTHMVFFLLYREKKLNLWFAITAGSISLYAFFKVGVFQSIFPDYGVAVRLEVVQLFTFTYFITLLVYTCGKDKFNIGMKIFTGIYVMLTAALFLPGHQFALDIIKLFFVLFVPFIVYAFISSLCVPLVREARRTTRDGHTAPYYFLQALAGTLRGNIIVGSFLPITFAIFDQISYVIFSYQEIILAQYGFLFFFANVTFALAADNAETHNKLLTLRDELRALISERESELEQKSGEVEQARSAQLAFRGMVSRDIRAPLAEIIGAIELRMLSSGLSDDSKYWLNRLLEAEGSIRKQLDNFLGDEADYQEFASPAHGFGVSDSPNKKPATSNPGGTRHLFVINPKSFVTLKDLKNFLLSIEKCFSVGHRADYKVYISRYPRDAYSAVRRYLTETPKDETARIYAVGGDGILFDCLNGLAQFPNAELAPIPYGNANDFVLSYGADNKQLFRDIKLMSKSPSQLVDAILCGQQYALCGCSIGIEARAVQVFSKLIERINFGRARYLVPHLYKLGAIKSLFDGSQSDMNYKLTIDGQDYSGDYTLINIGNIALNGGGNTPNPLAIPNDGILNVITCHSTSVIRALRMLPAYTSGKYTEFPDNIYHNRFMELHCKSENLMSVILDGETFYTHELDLKLLPKAIKVVSPGGIGFADYSRPSKGDAK